MRYPMCKITSVINPGKYCVVSIDKEHVQEVKILEESMRTEMLFQDTSEFQLNSQMCVAVTDLNDNFRRGIIQKEVDDLHYQVLLIDYGRLMNVHRSRIQVITNKRFLRLEPLAFTVKLYGLIPTERVAVGQTTKARAVKDWSPESYDFVNNIFEENCKIVVQNVLIRKRVVYGDLFMRPEPNAKFVSIRKLLCKKGFCTFSESNFVKLENLNTNDYSAELEKKMTFVDKWRRENFGGFRKDTYELPTPIPIKKDSVTNVTSLHGSESKFSGETSKLQGNETSESNEDSFETSSEFRKVGFGRGRWKFMSDQMRNREKCTSDESDRKSIEDELPKCLETRSKGRGQLLQKYLELKKSRELGTSQSQQSTVRTSSIRNRSEELSEVSEVERQSEPEEVYLSRLERVMVKPGEYSEFEDSNELTEVSFSSENEGPPPLVRNSARDVKPENPILKKDGSSSLKESQENGEILCSGMKERPCSSEANARLDSLEATDSESSWERPKSNATALNSCWTPYIVFHDSFIEPVRTFRELPIQPSIIKNLETGGKFDDLSQVQRWAIPAIRKQHNMIVIGSSKTGKTLSYLVPLIDYVQDESYFDELPQGNGPTVVIVASSSRVCESIYYMCHSLLGNFTRSKISKSKVQVIMAHGGGGCEKEVWVNLTNGCDILIATPHCLVRLLETPVLTNFERLTCLVLDEVDIISQNPFRKNTRVILETAQFGTRERYYQKILCGEKWTASVESFVKTFVKSYAAVICSYREAIIYEGLRPSIFLVHHERKQEVLLDKIRDKIGKSKILIVCEKMSEACFLNDFLTGKGVPTLLAHENVLAEKLRGFRTIWTSSKDTVLIVTDGVLNELNIREAQTLVHYGLPGKSKTNFFLRYSVLENFLRDGQSFSQFRKSGKSSKPQVIILIDDENHYQLPHVVDFVIRLGGKVTPQLLQTCENIRRLIEINKRNSPLCRNLMAFGRCRNARECPQRHAFVKSWDSHGSLPTSGWVNFEVIKIINASWLSARLTEHVDANGRTTKLGDSGLGLDTKLAEFFASQSNRRLVGVPKTGVVCAVKKVEEGKEVFYRGTIIEYLKLDKHEQPLEVSVRLMDEGDIWNRKTTELYELPDDLSIQPPIAVDIRVVGVQPMDFDVSWSQTANEFTKELMTRDLEENQYWSGEIVLSLKNVLFVEPVKRKQFLPHLKIHVFDLVLQEELLNNRIAVPNNDHLPALVKLAVEGELEIPKKETAKGDLAVLQPQWAFFDLDFVRVRFLAAETTSVVYLQPKKFQKLLDELEEDCQKAADDVKTRGVSKKSQTMDVGMFCLALFEDGRWNRARIEMENENQFQVFFVDHGDFMLLSKSDVVPIPQALLFRLPCQAIECSLVGMQENSSMDVLQEIYSFSNDGSEDLYACVVKKDLEPSVTKGPKYSVNLLNLKGISLNKMLVDANVVPVEESERLHLENFEISEEEEEQEETEVASDPLDVSPTGGENWLGGYFNNLKDDVFEDEDALEFLKEFASKVFPCAALPESNANSFKKETVEKEFLATSSGDAEPKLLTQNFERLLELHRKRRSKNKKEFSLGSRENVMTPQVLWCQNQLEVQMKIMLGNVSDYSVECTATNVSFRCFLGEKFYAVDLKLFGGINHHMTKVTVKAFHVLLVMTKLASSVWPRLHLDERKHRWISLDVESLTDKENVFSERIKAAKLEIDSGLVKKGFKSDDVRPCSDSEFSDEWVVGSDSEDDEDDDI